MRDDFPTFTFGIAAGLAFGTLATHTVLFDEPGLGLGLLMTAGTMVVGIAVAWYDD